MVNNWKSCDWVVLTSRISDNGFAGVILSQNCIWLFGHRPRWFIFLKKLFYEKQSKYAMNIGVAVIRSALLKFFYKKSALLYLCQILPSVSKITSGLWSEFLSKLPWHSILVCITPYPEMFCLIWQFHSKCSGACPNKVLYHPRGVKHKGWIQIYCKMMIRPWKWLIFLQTYENIEVFLTVPWLWWKFLVYKWT